MVVAACASLCCTELCDGAMPSTHGCCVLSSHTLELRIELCAALLRMQAGGVADEAQLLLQAHLPHAQRREGVLVEGEEANRAVLCGRALRGDAVDEYASRLRRRARRSQSRRRWWYAR